MRLLFVSHSLPPPDRPDSNIGGMQRVAQDLFHALGERPDIELSSLVLRTTWKDTHRKVIPFLFRAYREIRRQADEQSVDVILFSSMVTAALSVPLRKRLSKSGIRTASIVHGLDVTTSFWLYQRFVPRVFDSLDAVLPISRATRDACLERGLSKHKAFIVPNGIDIDRFDRADCTSTTAANRVANVGGLADVANAAGEEREAGVGGHVAGVEREAGTGGLEEAASAGRGAGVERQANVVEDEVGFRTRMDAAGTLRKRREALALLASSIVTNPRAIQNDETLLLTSVGRQVKRKGFEWFINEVMPILPENVHYWLAGDGPETQPIRSAITHRKLEHRVQLLGRVSDELLNALYRGGDLFVMPNIPVDGDMEGFGVVLLEAALNGQPAIAAGIEGILDVVSPGENGVLVESGDAQGFARAIQHFDADRDKLARLSTRTRDYTIKTFSWKSVAEQYVETLRSLLSNEH